MSPDARKSYPAPVTEPSAVRPTNAGRDGTGGSRPVASRTHAALRWLVVAAFLLRAVLSFVDAGSVADGGLRAIPFMSVAFGSQSALWPLMWGTLALVAALAMVAQVRIGWLVAFAVVVAYLVAGIADINSLVEAAAGDVRQNAETIVISLVVPILILAALLELRDAYLPSGHRRLGDGARGR